MQKSIISRFFTSETAGGVLLLMAVVFAIIVANSPAVSLYNMLLDTPVEIRIGALLIAKPLLLWINDGLMAIFFFLVGLELKREFIEGELSDRKNIILPAVGALGGMICPAIIYLLFNADTPLAAGGWAIPAATDIAFALGVLATLGSSRVPISIKIFLTSLAIFDDIGAIIIIALFYTNKISLIALFIVAASLLVLFLLNRYGVTAKSAYLFIGIIMWTATLKSGVHATIAGALLALFIPLHTDNPQAASPLKTLEHDLHPLISFVILPIFAFANAGIPLLDIQMSDIFHNVPLGIAAGLFIGKQVGILSFCWISIRLGVVSFPIGMNWRRLYGTAALCGVGFTMSLFIGSLAFEESGVNLLFDERIGILLGSIASGIVGYVVLHKTLDK